MNLAQLVKSATRTYLSFAYPKGVPKPIAKLDNQVQIFEEEAELLAWEELEREGDRFSLRLGNKMYPHMKLVFSVESQIPAFLVDAHDNHFDLPPGVPGFDKLMALRQNNQKLKELIEAAWVSSKIPIFGMNINVSQKLDCNGLDVLAIDDEVQILDILRLIVESMGACFLRAQTAAEARKVIGEKGLPDLIFCDIMMPNESGYDFVNWLEEKKYSDVPVYFITGYALDQVVKDDRTKVLQKPFTAKSIMKIMKQVKRK